LLLFLDGTVVVDEDKGVAEFGILGSIGASVVGAEIALIDMSNVGGVRREMQYLWVMVRQRCLGRFLLETPGRIQ